MTILDDGGPAFPQQWPDYNLDPTGPLRLQGGMTLRDYFAAHAPISRQDAIDSLDSSGEHVVGPWPESKILERLVLLRNAYADAMLAASKGKG